jgi:signal transduction histidine kinase
MQIRLVSEDSEISKLCTAILSDIVPDRDWSLSVSNIDGLRFQADLYVWDFRATLLPESPISCTSSNLIVLAQRRDLTALKNFLGFDPVVVLKPITSGALSAVFHFAVSSRTPESLRDDREQLLQNLLETNLKLQEYDQDRTTFLTRIAHDFRAPLTAMSGYCGLLLGEPLGPLTENQREVIRRMQYSATRLSRLASAMLQLGVERVVRKRPDFQRADIKKCVDQAIHEIHPLTEDKRIAVDPELALSRESLYFDPAQMEQVLVNLLDNACRFTPKGGYIEIRGYPFFWERRTGRRRMMLATERRQMPTVDPNAYRMDILDSGSPLPEEHLESIFEEFTTFGEARDRSGGGLGLAICRMILNHHDGWIWAENTSKGPRFSFVIPFRPFNSAHLSLPFDQLELGEQLG